AQLDEVLAGGNELAARGVEWLVEFLLIQGLGKKDGGGGSDVGRELVGHLVFFGARDGDVLRGGLAAGKVNTQSAAGGGIDGGNDKNVGGVGREGLKIAGDGNRILDGAGGAVELDDGAAEANPDGGIVREDLGLAGGAGRSQGGGPEIFASLEVVKDGAFVVNYKELLWSDELDGDIVTGETGGVNSRGFGADEPIPSPEGGEAERKDHDGGERPDTEAVVSLLGGLAFAEHVLDRAACVFGFGKA